MVLDPKEKKRRQEERRKQKYDKTHKIIDGVVYKQCNHHHEFFSEEDEWLPCTDEYFYINKMNGIDGLNTYCKRCTYAKATQWRLDNPERDRERCRRNSRKKGVREYHRKSNKKRLENGAMLEWQRNNRNKLNKYNRYRRMNKEHKIGRQEWRDCRNYFDYKCAYCGISEEEHKKLYKQGLHKEHVDPNGSIYLDNCIPACRQCNTSKHTEDMEVWYSKQNFYDKDKLNKIHMWINEDYKLYIKEHK